MFNLNFHLHNQSFYIWHTYTAYFDNLCFMKVTLHFIVFNTSIAFFYFGEIITIFFLFLFFQDLIILCK